MSRGTCKFCGQPVDWHRTPAGNWQPLNVQPTTNTVVGPNRPGSVVVRSAIAYTLPPGRSVERGEVLRVPHPAVCPGRREHGARGRADAADHAHAELDRAAEEAVERDTARQARQTAHALRAEAARLRNGADVLDRLADGVEIGL